MRNVRLALFLCDELVKNSPAIMAEHGTYADIFRDFLTSSLQLITSEVTFTLDVYVVYELEYPPEDVHYDGILISGSRRNPVPWVEKLVAYIKRTITEKPFVKIFGVCYGHQIVASALGGQVEKDQWEVSVTNIHLTPLGKALFHSDKLALQQFHERKVIRAPAHAHLLGSSATVHSHGVVMFDPKSAPSLVDLESDVLGIHLRSIHVLTFQGHPELTEPIMVKLIHQSAEYMGPELVADALSRVGLPTDGIDKVGKVMWGMFGVTSER